jgi:hypothetical protein
MGPRPLGQIWQFGLGSVWAVIGVLSLFAFSGLHYFLPPPSIDELRPVSGVLVGRVVVHRPSKNGLWASFALRGNEVTLDARINNYGFLWNCNDTPRLLQIESGAEITVYPPACRHYVLLILPNCCGVGNSCRVTQGCRPPLAIPNVTMPGRLPVG